MTAEQAACEAYALDLIDLDQLEADLEAVIWRGDPSSMSFESRQRMVRFVPISDEPGQIVYYDEPGQIVYYAPPNTMVFADVLKEQWTDAAF